jgi:hypothetical protein
MKKLIKNILNDVSKTQVNLESEAAQDMIVNLIMDGIKSNKGWFLDLGTHGKDKDKDTAGYPIKKINDYLVRDIDEIQMIDQEKLYTIVENLGWDARDKKQMIIGKITESQYASLID